ncbi:MAG: erythromycin esterase family protein [Pseudomonadota bacterium]
MHVAIPAILMTALLPAAPVLAQARGTPIVSTESEEYRDLTPLKRAIGETRIVLLGESSHGVSDYTRIKTRLIRFLHDKMGFTVIAFESPMFGCAIANRLRDHADPGLPTRACLWAVWHSDEHVELMRMAGERAATLSIAGVDNQPGSGDRPARRLYFASLLNPAEARRAEALEDRFWEQRNVRYSYQERYKSFGENWRSFADEYAALAAILRAAATRTPPEKRVELLFGAQIASTTMRFIEATSNRDAIASAEIRDVAMTENLRFLADTVYPGRKIIVFAHNAHVSRANELVDHKPGNFPGFRALGGLLAAQNVPAYRLGLFARRGEMASNSRKIAAVTAPGPKSFEAMPVPKGAVGLFFDLAHNRRNAAALSDVTTKEWGGDDISMNLSQQFDGVILLDTVKPPAYRGNLPLYDPATVPLP